MIVEVRSVHQAPKGGITLKPPSNFQECASHLHKKEEPITSATVTTSVEYAEPIISGPQTSKTLDNPQNGELSGKADENGNSATVKHPNNEGGSDESVDTWTIPEGKKLVKAKANITLKCTNSTILELSAEGNVSATARLLPGPCIEVVAVSRTQDSNGVVSVTTTSKKKCCPRSR